MPTTSLYCCKLFPIFTSLHALLKIQCRSKVRFSVKNVTAERACQNYWGGGANFPPYIILGDPGAVSQEGRKGAAEVFKHD